MTQPVQPLGHMPASLGDTAPEGWGKWIPLAVRWALPVHRAAALHSDSLGTLPYKHKQDALCSLTQQCVQTSNRCPSQTDRNSICTERQRYIAAELTPLYSSASRTALNRLLVFTRHGSRHGSETVPHALQTTSLSHQTEAVTHQADAIMQRPGEVTVLPQICFENHRRTPAEAPNPLQQLKPRGNCRSNSAVLTAAAAGLPHQPPPHSRPAPTVAPRPPPAAPHAPSFPADPWGSTQAGHPLPERCPGRKPPSGMPCAPLPSRLLLPLLLLLLPAATAPPAPREALESRPDWWRREGRRERPPAAPSWPRPAPPRADQRGP